MSHNIPPSVLGRGGWDKRKELGLGRPRLTDHSKQMRSLLSQGQPTLATLNCTSLRNLNCHFKSLRLPWLPNNMDIRHWLPNNLQYLTDYARSMYMGMGTHSNFWLQTLNNLEGKEGRNRGVLNISISSHSAGHSRHVDVRAHTFRHALTHTFFGGNIAQEANHNQC